MRWPTTLSFLAAAALVNGSVGAIERSVMLSHAPSYEGHEWTCEEINTTGTSCPGRYLSDFTPGTYVGIPYDWGGFVTPEEFDADLADGVLRVMLPPLSHVVVTLS